MIKLKMSVRNYILLNIGCKLDLDLNWKKDDLDNISYINGSLLVEKNCTINMNINFNSRIATEKVIRSLIF